MYPLALGITMGIIFLPMLWWGWTNLNRHDENEHNRWAPGTNREWRDYRQTRRLDRERWRYEMARRWGIVGSIAAVCSLIAGISGRR